MSTLRITGAGPEVLKVHRTRDLVEVLHVGLRDAKRLADDILDDGPVSWRCPRGSQSSTR